MSEALSLGDPNEGVTLHSILKGEKLELSLTICHQKIFAIGLEYEFLSIETPSFVEVFITVNLISGYWL